MRRDHCPGLHSLLQKPGYVGKPASRQASIKVSVNVGTTPMAAQYALKLKDGCCVSASIAAALASSVRPSLARAVASRLRVTLKLGLDRTARRAALTASSYCPRSK